MRFIVTPRHRYIDVEAFGREGIAIFPTWLPGSYVIRELERYIIDIDGIRLNKNRFYVKEHFKYTVQAMSLDQREVISTKDYLFINPPSVFPFQNINEEYCIDLRIPKYWKIHTTLYKEGETYCASNYHELADSPIQASPYLKQIMIDDKHFISTINDLTQKEVENIKKIVDFQDSLLGNPYSPYIFFFRRSIEGKGGIEHANSSAIVSNWESKIEGVFAHEFFHRWNVKRMYPKDLNLNYEQESYTDLLWVSEGLTEYMAIYTLMRTGIQNTNDILNTFANYLAELTFNGIKRMSLAESSLTTWIKLYRRDENFRNVGISYYVLGSIVGLIMHLDMISKGHDITEFFRELYKVKEFTYADVKSIAEKLGVEILDELVYTRDPPIIKRLSKYFSIDFIDKGKMYYGILIDENTMKITFVEDNSPADDAGLMPGDKIIAIDGVERKNIEAYDKAFFTIEREGNIYTIEIEARENPGHNLSIKGNSREFEIWASSKGGEGTSNLKIL